MFKGNKFPTSLFRGNRILLANLWQHEHYLKLLTPQEAHKSKPTVDPCEPVKYELNTEGFRSDEFSKRGAFNVLFIGCGQTFGSGLPLEFTWPWLFGSMVQRQSGCPVSLWNLGLPGQSNDYIARATISAEPLLKPNLLVLLFTFVARREIWIDENWIYNHNPSFRPAEGTIECTLYDRLEECSNESQNSVNLFLNYTLVDQHLKYRNAPFLFSMLEPHPNVLPEIDHSRYVPFAQQDLGSNCRFASAPNCSKCQRKTGISGGFRNEIEQNVGRHYWGRKTCSDFAGALFERARTLGIINE